MSTDWCRLTGAERLVPKVGDTSAATPSLATPQRQRPRWRNLSGNALAGNTSAATPSLETPQRQRPRWKHLSGNALAGGDLSGNALAGGNLSGNALAGNTLVDARVTTPA